MLGLTVVRTVVPPAVALSVASPSAALNNPSQHARQIPIALQTNAARLLGFASLANAKAMAIVLHKIAVTSGAAYHA